MKRVLALLLGCLLAAGLAGCGGHISDELERLPSEPSALYSDSEINDAIKAVETYFRQEFSGCTLTAIGYAGDEKSLAETEYAQRVNGDEVLVLTSSFNVDSSGGDGSLRPNSTYTRWNWIMARKAGGAWQHVDHGYS